MKCVHEPIHRNLKDSEIEAKIIEVLKHNDEVMRQMFEKFKKDNVCAGDFLTIVANVLARMGSMYLYHATCGGKTDDGAHHLLDLLRIIATYNGIDMQIHHAIEEDGSTRPHANLH